MYIYINTPTCIQQSVQKVSFFSTKMDIVFIFKSINQSALVLEENKRKEEKNKPTRRYSTRLRSAMMNFASKRICSSSTNSRVIKATTLACVGSVTFASISTTRGCGNQQNQNHCQCQQGEELKNTSTDKDGESFFNYFPKSQLFQPKKPYPAWDDNWDGKEEEHIEKTVDGVTRHIILVR